VKAVVGDLGIYITSGLDEYRIDHFLQEGGIATGFGVGSNLVTIQDIPVAEIVYKLVQVEENGKKIPSMKFSDGKRTYPGEKSIKRLVKNGKYQKDILALKEEELEGEEQLINIYSNGKLIYELPQLETIQKKSIESIFALPESCKGIESHEPYEVEISKGINSLIGTLL
jgi:nicotinate phosphoribosyltransferase